MGKPYIYKEVRDYMTPIVVATVAVILGGGFIAGMVAIVIAGSMMLD